jgi:hypothetical protein
MTRDIVVNRATATLAKLLAIKRRTKSVAISDTAGTHYVILKTGLEMYLGSSVSIPSFMNMINDSKDFIQKVRTKSNAKQ